MNRCDEYAEMRKIIHPPCTHTDRPNCLSLPSMGNPFMCRECWDLRFKDHKWAGGFNETWPNAYWEMTPDGRDIEYWNRSQEKENV